MNLPTMGHLAIILPAICTQAMIVVKFHRFGIVISAELEDYNYTVGSIRFSVLRFVNQVLTIGMFLYLGKLKLAYDIYHGMPLLPLGSRTFTRVMHNHFTIDEWLNQRSMRWAIAASQLLMCCVVFGLMLYTERT